MIILFNHDSVDQQINKMDKIAQIIFQLYNDETVLIECSNLDTTTRGKNGFGSTDRPDKKQTLNFITDKERL